MKLTFGKNLSNVDKATIQEIANECGLTLNTATLLFYRNIKSVVEAKTFLSPSKSYFLNPFDLSGMSTAVERIAIAKEKGQSILVFGDYDADGICATTILYKALKVYGLTARLIVPEREEGYGLNYDKIIELNTCQKIDLIITVDCGISEAETISKLINNGIDVIVTDHHEIPPEIPNCTVINPKLKNQKYSFSGLCGAGVAYKLAYALIGEKADEYLDFVALATLADSMEIVGENRSLVVEGLKLFNNNLKENFAYLSPTPFTQINAQTLVYNLAPKVNAGGRMGDALTALKLFISTDKQEIIELSSKLFEYNLQRQTICDEVYKQAKEIIISEKLYKKDIILVQNKNWNLGVAGIVAARLVEDYNLPVIVFAGKDGHLKGSARSIDGINIYDCILSCSHLLLTFGGHSQAAGVAVEDENYNAFYAMLNEKVANVSIDVSKEKEVFIDILLNGAVSTRFAKEIELLEPFGVGNRKPLFACKCGGLKPQKLNNNSPHYQMQTEYLNLLDFNGEKDVKDLELNAQKYLVFELNYSVYKGKEYVKGFLKDYTLDITDDKSLTAIALKNELNKLKLPQNQGGTKIFRDQTAVKSGYGTLYLITDPNNIKNYSLSGVKIHIHEKPEDSLNALIISPSYIPNGYDKIVYLDYPLTFLPTNAKTYAVCDLQGKSLLTGLSTDRNQFILVFNALKNSQGKTVEYAENLAKNNGVEYKNFIFALEVFKELSIVAIKNGVIAIDSQIVNPLTNSQIYNKILSY